MGISTVNKYYLNFRNTTDGNSRNYRRNKGSPKQCGVDSLERSQGPEQNITRDVPLIRGLCLILWYSAEFCKESFGRLHDAVVQSFQNHKTLHQKTQALRSV